MFRRWALIFSGAAMGLPLNAAPLRSDLGRLGAIAEIFKSVFIRHDPEKWKPVFEKRSCPNKCERDL